MEEENMNMIKKISIGMAEMFGTTAVVVGLYWILTLTTVC